jgi:hypothetical protein
MTPFASAVAVSIVAAVIGGVGTPNDGTSNHSGVIRSGTRSRVALVEHHNRAGAGVQRVRPLLENGHVPRWTSAIDPAGMPAKSSASQALVFALMFGAGARAGSGRPTTPWP